LQDLAGVLLVPAGWDYQRFCEYQGALADHVTQTCRPVHPTTGEAVEYTERQIRGALKTLEQEGYIYIPRTVSREEKLAKVYSFKQAFLDILNGSPLKSIELEPVDASVDASVDAGASSPAPCSPAREVETAKMCDNSLLRPNRALSDSTGNNTTSDSQSYGVNIKESRAIDRTKRDPNEKISSGGDSQAKKTVYSRSHLARDLSPIQRQMVHWLAGCDMLTGQAESIRLCGDFLSRCDTNSNIGYWVQTWPEMTKSEKSFAIRQLVGALRQLPPAAPPLPPDEDLTSGSSEPESDPQIPPQFEISRFRAALFFGETYDGPGQDFISRFRAADQNLQDCMLADLQIKIKTGKIVFDD